MRIILEKHQSQFGVLHIAATWHLNPLIESHLPEFHHWLADHRSLAAYFRGPPNIRDGDIRLHAQNLGREKEVRRLPMHHQVRFAQHLFNLVDSS